MSDPKVLYFCDRKACKVCNSDAGGACRYTSDIRHAVNFEDTGSDTFWEKLPSDVGENR